MNADRIRCAAAVWALVGSSVLTALSGCGATQRGEVSKANGCAMLASDVCKNLVAVVGENRVALRYMASGVDWSQYPKVLISPVAFYGGAKSKVSAADQQELINFMYRSLVDAIGARFPLAEAPGPGVVRLQVGLTDVEGATPGLRSVSMVVPQARALATLKYVATGTYPFVGSAKAEALLTDSVSGQTLAGVVDRRVGGGSVATAAQWSLGDAEAAVKQWAELTATRLSELQNGTFSSTDS